MADSSVEILWNRPEAENEATPTIVLAHGAGAAMDTPFMNTMATGLATAGLVVARFEFPYMRTRREEGSRRPPDRAPKLLDAWREVIAQLHGRRPLIIGGKSMGGRMASMVADETQGGARLVDGLVCLGYPFHPPGRPEKLRTEHLETLETPTLIVQGSRDPFGKPNEVERYNLSPAIRGAWLEDGDHSFKPRKASGFTLDQHLETAIKEIALFVGALNA